MRWRNKRLLFILNSFRNREWCSFSNFGHLWRRNIRILGILNSLGRSWNSNNLWWGYNWFLFINNYFRNWVRSSFRNYNLRRRNIRLLFISNSLWSLYNILNRYRIYYFLLNFWNSSNCFYIRRNSFWKIKRESFRNIRWNSFRNIRWNSFRKIKRNSFWKF